MPTPRSRIRDRFRRDLLDFGWRAVEVEVEVDAEARGEAGDAARPDRRVLRPTACCEQLKERRTATDGRRGTRRPPQKTESRRCR